MSWDLAGGLAAKVGAFVEGAGNFVASLGIPRPIAVALMAVMVASFAATTLDTATRLQRYVIQELATTANIGPLTTKHGATLLAVGVAAGVAAIPPPGRTWAAGMGTGGLILWPIFGATNQLLAGLSFLVIVFYLLRNNRPVWFAVPPMIIMLIMPAWAMYHQLQSWWAAQNWLLLSIGVVVEIVQVWMVVEAILLWGKIRGVAPAPLPPLPRRFPVASNATPAGKGMC